MKKSKGFRLTLTGKLMILILSVVICAILAIAFMSYRQSSRALTKSVHEQLTAVANDISHQIDSINKKAEEILQSCGISNISPPGQPIRQLAQILFFP